MPIAAESEQVRGCVGRGFGREKGIIYGVHGPTSCRRQLHRCCYVPHDRIRPFLPIAIDDIIHLCGGTCHAGWVLEGAVIQFPPGNGGAGGGSGRARAIMFLYRNVDVGNVMVHTGLLGRPHLPQTVDWHFHVQCR